MAIVIILLFICTWILLFFDLRKLNNMEKLLEKNSSEKYNEELLERLFSEKIEELEANCIDILAAKQQLSVLLNQETLDINTLVSETEKRAYAIILADAENLVASTAARLAEINDAIDSKQESIDDHLAADLCNIADRECRSLVQLKKQRKFCEEELRTAETNLQKILHPSK